jgi:chemotaxis protein methyltransferase CheR
VTSGPALADVDRFRAAIVGRLGLHFDESKREALSETLRRRLDATRIGVDTYLAGLEANGMPAEVRTLAAELTVPETYFFRNADQCRAFSQLVVPARLHGQVGKRRLRMLSLACASGEEAFTLAMLVREALHDPAADVSILGVDINGSMIEKARRGRYSSWALRETSDADREKWFRRSGKDYVVDESLHAWVTFAEHNLADANLPLWQEAAYDVVFCRNMIMYFAPEQAKALVARIAGVLRDGGYLFLGHAETLRGLSNDFHLCHTHGTFYYQRKDRIASKPVASGDGDTALAPAALAEIAADAQTWVDVIHRASERVAALTKGGSRAGRKDGNGAAAVLPPWDLGLVLELLRKERFAEALALMDALPADATASADVLLLRSVLLTHNGQLAAAEDACRAVLGVDELNAGAHYVLALCREGVGDPGSALYHDQVAMYLDPAFAMPHLHHGLRARRMGNLEDARRELATALMLLPREDASRLLMFGGGFEREALVALCRTELARCGGKA